MPIEMTRADFETAVADAVKAQMGAQPATPETETADPLEKLYAHIDEAIAKAVGAAPGVINTPDVATDVIVPAKANADLAKLDHGEVALLVGKTMRALMAAKGDARGAIDVVKNKWGCPADDMAIKMLIAGTDASGGFMVPEVVSPIFMDLLLPFAVVRSLNPVVLPMPSGNMTLNGGLTAPTASYIGEADAIPASSATFRRIALAAKKLVGLVPFSNDLLRFNSPQVDKIVSGWLFKALSNREDLAFIRGDGVADTPIGFRNIPGIYTATMTATPTYITVQHDFALMNHSMDEANLPESNRGWMYTPRNEMYLKTLLNTVTGHHVYKDEMEQGKLLGYPYRTTTQIPQNLGGGTETEVYLVNFGDVIIGDTMAITMTMSSEASYVDPSSVTRSAFQNDLTLLRAIALHDIAIQYDESVSILTGVTWAP